MSIEVKQKIKEVADDFAMPAKKLIEICLLYTSDAADE